MVNPNRNTMISNSNLKLIRTLRQKKYRDRYGLYIVEGEKMVKEVLKLAGKSGHRPEKLFATPGFLESHSELIYNQDLEVAECSIMELEKASNLVTPQPVLALVSRPAPFTAEAITARDPVLAFESIRDPGNLGTILRTADWFGIRQVVCSPDSVDPFNPKVVQSTMGAIFRVRVIVSDLSEWLAGYSRGSRQIIGTFLTGENLYRVKLDKNPVILFGNESGGLSDRFDAYLTQKVSIPTFHRASDASESLNVAASAAVICSELRRESLSGITQSGS